MIERSTRLNIKHYGVFLSSMGPGLPEIQSTISAALIPLNPLRDFLPMFESHTIRSQYTTLMRGSIPHSFATCFNLLKLTMALGVASYFDDWIMVIAIILGWYHGIWWIWWLNYGNLPLCWLISPAFPLVLPDSPRGVPLCFCCFSCPVFVAAGHAGYGLVPWMEVFSSRKYPSFT